MLKNSAYLSNHLILAIEHHKQLIEDAKRHRDGLIARRSNLDRPMRWRRLRTRVGEWMIYLGERLKNDAPKPVWG